MQKNTKGLCPLAGSIDVTNSLEYYEALPGLLWFLLQIILD